VTSIQTCTAYSGAASATHRMPTEQPILSQYCSVSVRRRVCPYLAIAAVQWGVDPTEVLSTEVSFSAEQTEQAWQLSKLSRLGNLMAV
jgi:hypothetical protein